MKGTQLQRWLTRDMSFPSLSLGRTGPLVLRYAIWSPFL